MKGIKLTKGKFTIVDSSDFKYLNTVKWFYLNPGYAARTIRLKGNKFKKQLMHRLIMNAPNGLEVDHKNGNKLDNRRSNLRLCTKAENHRNRGLQKSNTSGYKGVCWSKRNKKWIARIAFNGKRYDLGYFSDIRKAAQAYNNAAKKYHKEFAKLNIKE